MKPLYRYLNRNFTVGNAVCLMQILLALGIANAPVLPTGAAARVQTLSNDLITPLSVFVTFLAFGCVGLVYGLIKIHTPVTIMIFGFPFLFYGCAVSLQTAIGGHSFSGIAVYLGIVLIITAHLWQRTRLD